MTEGGLVELFGSEVSYIKPMPRHYSIVRLQRKSISHLVNRLFGCC